MATILSDSRIKADIAETRTRMDSLKEELRELQEALDDLLAAERLLEKYGRRADESGGEHVEKGPTIANKIAELLGESDRISMPDILDRLHKTWRSDLTKNTLISTLYRMKEKELAANENGKWFLILQRRRPQQ